MTVLLAMAFAVTGVFNVRDFGVRGDGLVKDTAARGRSCWPWAGWRS